MTRLTKKMLRIAALALATASIAHAEVADTLRLGDAASESAHGLVATSSDVAKGGLGEPSRRLLPLQPVGDYGGNVKFTVKCDPTLPTYVTVKLWGGDAGEERGRLLLFAEGKQVGVRHIGDHDILDVLSNEPRFPGRFAYKTVTLPPAMTKGKTSIDLEIRALGRMWGYGETWDKFQKKLEQPSRGIYAVYTHTDPFFAPAADERQGEAIAKPPVRTEPGPEVLDAVKARVGNEVKKLLAADALNQMQMLFLARAYHVQWTPAYRNPKVVERLARGIDAHLAAYAANPKLAESDPTTPNAEWFGSGPTGAVVALLAEALRPTLDATVDGGVTRRAALGKLLVHCRDWHTTHRRLYTNQSMINDLYGIYYANRGLAVVDPGEAMPEEKVRRYLYESVGLQPWLGNDLPGGGSAMPVGPNYLQMTDKGLTKELGYVGAYGEVLDWMVSIYDATRPTPGEPGDERIKAQLAKAAKARAIFRHPLIDAEGHRAMALETVVGWRDSHYPGDITYAQRTAWDGGPLDTPAATLDPALIGYGQQMLEDNQFFAAMSERMKDRGFRVTAGLLAAPDSYEAIKRQPTVATRLPMTPGQPDFVFADEEDGVVAIKHGDEVLYASLYWRARFGINRLARVHYLTPTVERDATVWQDVQFDDSGMTTTRDDRVVEAQTRRHERSKGDVKQAYEGEVLPIAKIPEGVNFKPGQESVYAGKGTFYAMRYGPYVIGMNMTKDRAFDLALPAGAKPVKDLVAGGTRPAGGSVKVGPRSTAVFYVAE